MMEDTPLSLGLAIGHQGRGTRCDATPTNLGGTGALYLAHWLSESAQQKYIAECERLKPTRMCIRLYGRATQRPRETAWMARRTEAYRYGGTVDVCRGWPRFVDELSARISEHAMWTGPRPPDCDRRDSPDRVRVAGSSTSLHDSRDAVAQARR